MSGRRPITPDARRAKLLPRWKKLTYGVLATLLFFGTLELLLAIFGVRPLSYSEDPFVGFDGAEPLFVESVTLDARIMKTANNKLAYFNDQQFPARKQFGTYRVFCLGGSTTYGRPYDDGTSFCGWLRELLSLADDSKWEVINAGGISYASYRVAAVMEELTEYEPDLFIVYTGQNEFLEERTYGELRDSSLARRRMTGLLSKTRVYASVRSLLLPRTEQNRELLPGEVDAVLDHTVGPSSYHRDEELAQRVLAHFEYNVRRMIELARGCGAKIIFVTPASNLKGFSPFKSEHRAGLDEASVARFDELLRQAKRLEPVVGESETTLDLLRKAERIDDRFAELHYLKGRVQLELGDLPAARKSFRRAIDEDVCPLRALSSIPKLVRGVCRQEDVPVVDFEALLAADCLRRHGHNSPGSEYFLDHVHPTIAANGLLARGIVEEMIEQKIAVGGEYWNEYFREQAAQKIHNSVGRLDQAAALRNLAKVLNWAGKHEEAGPLALKSLKTNDSDPEALFLAAVYLRSRGELDRAIDHFRRSLDRMPEYAEAHQMLGAALVEKQEFATALGHFRELARLRPNDGDAHGMVGAVLAELGKFEDATEAYQRALRLKSGDANLHYNYAFALAHLNRRREAIEQYRLALAINANDADAHFNLGVLLEQDGHVEEAARHHERAVEIRAELKDGPRRHFIE